MWHVWKTEETDAGFWSEHLKERDPLEDLCVDGKIILKCIIKK